MGNGEKPEMCQRCGTIYLGFLCPNCKGKENEPAWDEVPDFLKSIFGGDK